MTITTLPLFSEPSYSYVASLGSTPFQFRFNWNDRAAAWHMDILTESGTPIVVGQRMVPGFAMTMDYVLEPYGLDGFFALVADNKEQAAMPILEPKEFTERFELLYIT